MRNTALITVIVALFLSTAPLAHADSGAYLEWLTSHGVVGNGPGQYGEEFLLQTGTNTCAAIREGKSDSFLMGQLIDAYQMGRAQSDDIVYAAHHYLCPNV
jgi:hypothetical protein